MSRCLATLVLFTVACASPPPRVYYGPVGAGFGKTIGEWSWQDERASFRVRCQGSYLNEVGGRRVRSVHLQLVASRTSGESLVLPLSLFSVEALGESGWPPLPLPLSALWAGRERLQDALVVPPWSRRTVDMFFDGPAFEQPPAELLRLRFGARRADGTLQLHECQFFRLAADDPRRPDEQALADPGHGYRDGYYFPGRGDLGERRLRTSNELRLFYLFHDPDEGWLW